jgi:signal transduction histidine kinase
VLGWLLYLTAPGINPARYRLARILLLLVIAQVLFYTVDLVRSFFGNIDVWGESFHITQLAFPLMQLVLMGALFNRFLTTLQQAEELNRTLASKIEASRRDIELSFSNKRAHELQQAADTERIRIYRELHDDLGSKLLSIAHAGRDSRMGDLASSALQSLRESVSRANYPDQPLAKFVQDLKEETLLRLESSGHRVDWHQAHLPDCMLPSHIAFHLNRMAKKIVTNIIRHARASHVSAGVETEQGDLVFSLADNGIGIGMNGYSGNGMQNIRTRAEEIAGKVRFESPAGKGLTVTLSIPLDTGREEDG